MKEFNAGDFILKADTHYYNAIHLYKAYIENAFPHHRYDPLPHIAASCSLAGEIYVKAYMEENNINYEHNHKMVRHLNQCVEYEKSFEIIKKDIDLLVYYTSNMNYPNEVEINKANINKAIKAVEHKITFQEIKNLREKYAIEDVALYVEKE